MNSAIQIVMGLIVLIIGEYIIYTVAMSLDLPLIIKWLFILVIPVGIIIGIFKLLTR